MMDLAILLFAAAAIAVQPDAKEIVRKSVAVNDADFQAIPKYTHRETDVQTKLDSSGQQTSVSKKTIEVLMIEGSPYEKLLAVNGKPLSAEDQRKEEEKLQKEIAKRRSESASARSARIAKYQKSRRSDHLMMQQMVFAFNFKFVGEDMVNGRPAYVLDAEPRPDYRPLNQEAKVLTGMKGRLWVDKTGYHWMKVKAEVIKPVNYALFIAKVGPGTSFEFEQTPVNANLWLPSRFEQDVNAKILGIKSIRTREQETYTNYQPANKTQASH